MAKLTADSVLEKHSLKKTSLRRSLVAAFLDSQGPLSQAEVIEAVSKDQENVDRVSVYRNLSALKEAGILHEVDSNRYVFCSHECAQHAHLLLFCQSCHKHLEIKDHGRIDSFMEALNTLRFFGKKQPIFLRGLCSSCTG